MSSRETETGFFRDFHPEGVHIPPLDEYWANRKNRNAFPLVTSETLRDYLGKALLFLANEPGPNYSFRALHVHDWLLQWLLIVNNYTRYDFADSFRGPRAVPFEHVPRIVDMVHAKGIETGVLFAAGMEGGIGHRHSIEYMARIARVFPILILDSPENFRRHGKSRQAPFLDLVVRLEMWSRFAPIGCVTVCPTIRDEDWLDLDAAYSRVFEQTHAQRCFADEQDPYVVQKTHRGVYRRENRIPHEEVPATTRLVEKLMPDADETVLDWTC